MLAHAPLSSQEVLKLTAMSYKPLYDLCKLNSDVIRVRLLASEHVLEKGKNVNSCGLKPETRRPATSWVLPDGAGGQETWRLAAICGGPVHRSLESGTHSGTPSTPISSHSSFPRFALLWQSQTSFRLFPQNSSPALGRGIPMRRGIFCRRSLDGGCKAPWGIRILTSYRVQSTVDLHGTPLTMRAWVLGCPSRVTR